MTEDTYMTVREMLSEVRDDVKALRSEVKTINEQGSIGTKAELQDHESRIRSLEIWKFGIPVTGVGAVAAVVAAVFNSTS